MRKIDAAGTIVKDLGIFRPRDFVATGYPQEYLRRLVASGKVRRLGRGLYMAATLDFDQNLSLLQAAKKVPRGVICLSSALQFHGIGTQSPHRVWIAVPRDAHLPRPGDLPFRFLRFSKASYSFGVQVRKLPGGIVRVYSAAKTVADCFKYRNRYGLDMAVEALQAGWRSRKFTLNELAAAAETCRVRRVIQPYLEMLP